MRKTLSFLVAIVMILAMSLSSSLATQEDQGDIVVLYTNDVHCGVTDNIGYTSVAAYKNAMIGAGHDVLLVDAGDAVQGAPIGTLSDGEYIIDIMNAMGYALMVPGNHEFDYGMEQFNNLVEMAEFEVISSNFMDLTTNETVLEPYSIIEMGGVSLAFIGISTPETISKSTPAAFQNDEGEYIFGFCADKTGEELYETVQNSIDSAKADGADYIIGLAHLGVDPTSAPWRSTDVIANTTGFDVILDGHSHTVIESEVVNDKDNEPVLLTSTGTKLQTFGKLVITDDGEITTELIEEYPEQDPEIQGVIDGIISEYDQTLQEVVGHTDVDLVVNDPETGDRLVRSRETNLANFCADAYRAVLGTDIGIVNGGNVRADILAGDITYEDILTVHPFGNMTAIIEVTGQQLLEALEHGASALPEAESGGFLHVSGVTYDIHAYMESPVIMDENDMFIGIEGEHRVKNVTVGGEPLDLEKTYTLGGNCYTLLQLGDGYTMFQDSNVILAEGMLDSQLLIEYLKDHLGGVVGEEYENPYGEGRITIYASADEVPDPTPVPDGDTPNPPATGMFSIIGLAMASAIVGGGAIVCNRRRNAK